ncbi:hypothetical protein lerEdw1_011822 [Lerista edwardsae]|nr:hypothetical protein lerEdw1_011822 [Lerista edwardsae]
MSPNVKAAQTGTPPVMSDKRQHQEDKSQIAVEETAADQQRKFVEFLSAFDKIQKSTNPGLVSKNTGVQAFVKLFGKTIKKENLDGQSSPLFSYQEGAEDLSKDLLEIYPLSGKNFRKAAPLTPKKTKKRGNLYISAVTRPAEHMQVYYLSSLNTINILSSIGN